MSSSRPVEFAAKPLGFAVGVIKEHSPRAMRRSAQEQVLRVTRTAFRGGAVECPACGATASRFVRTRCPSCAAQPRQRLIAFFLKREVKLGLTNARVLHFAPEPGLIRMISAMPRVDYVPGDLVPDSGHEQVDATSIHLQPTFDGVITSHVLEHVPNDAAAIAEMFRVLKPGGWAVVLVPVSHRLETTYEDPTIVSRWGRHRHYGQHDHVRLYGRDFPERLRHVGFDVEERRPADELPPEVVGRMGLGRGVIHYCRKPAGSSGVLE